MANVLVGERRRLKLLNKEPQALRLRAHHICCIPSWKIALEGRGSDFYQIENKIKDIMLSQPESLVMVAEGVDELCKVCPLCVDERCNSPQGNEDEVRKWDATLLKELGLPLGSCLTSGEWRALMEQKTPFKLCKRCQWQKICSVGASLL